MSAIHLMHDVLDAQLVDRQKNKIGRVDALMLELREGRPPRVATILIGGPARAERLGRWAVVTSRVMRALLRVRKPGVDHIPFRAMRRLGGTIELDVDCHELESQHVEDWLADHLICHIPWAQD
ncbi:MAG TPA: hypothetical protein VGG78_03950 [Gemmatimonadaceae bacterium]